MVFIFFSCKSDKKSADAVLLPVLHFTHGENWTGEPAGGLYYDGEYHLFYQYNPEQPVFGNIHWGHAVSKDLISWDILPPALSPDEKGKIYSGSVIIDLHNISGQADGNIPPFIAYYTYSDEKDVMAAYSLDKGYTWTKYDNPVIKITEQTGLKNPNVSWNEKTGKWLMTVSTGTEVRLYSSPDCLNWSYLSEFGEDNNGERWEGSSLFSLKASGEDFRKWILIVNIRGGSANGTPAIRYFTGEFDGKEFHSIQNKELWIDYGFDNYGGMIFNNTPGNQVIMTGWMSCWNYAHFTPDEKYRGRMVFPRELKLVKEGGNYLLSSYPVKNISSVMKETHTAGNMKISGKVSVFEQLPFPKTPFLVKLSFDNSNKTALWAAKDYGIRFITKTGKALSIGYKADMEYYYIDRRGLAGTIFSEDFEQLAGVVYVPKESVNEWTVLHDKGSVELFAGEGKAVISSIYYSDDDFVSFELFSESGSSDLIQLKIEN
jgi:fructan beta-fructosidase